MSNDQLPERDPTKTNAQQGLYGKFRIERTDGSSAPGGKHHDCDYFVLDVTHDKHAKEALAAYADAAEATHPQLAADMRARWRLPVPTAHHAPIARITIGKSGGIFGPQHLYAPGLPPGEHDLWCVPVRAAAQPAGDAAMSRDELQDQWSLIIQSCIDVMPAGHMAKYATAAHACGSPLPVAVAALTARIAALEALSVTSILLDFVPGDGDGLEVYAKSVADVEALLSKQGERIEGLESDLVEERNRIASMRTDWGAEVAALTERVQFHVAMTRDAQEAASAAQAQARHAEAEAAKSERRATELGDALHRNILAMRAALADCHRHGPHHGMHWIVNTLDGPGQLPDADDVALGGQALFDKEVAEHEAFRAANPGPVALRDLGATFQAEAGSTGDLSADEAGLTACVTCGAPAGAHAEPVMVDMMPPATARDRWMYQQGRLAERDPRTRAIDPTSAPRDTSAMLAELMRLVTEVGRAGWACDSARLRAAEIAIEASARRMLGEAS